MRKLPLASCVFVSLLLLARVATAGVCVEVDASRDSLPESDRNATRFFLAQTLQQQGVEVVQQNCAGTYVVYHVRLGNSITIFMQGPQGYRQATARVLEDVPAVYSQMVRSLLSGQPMHAGNDTVDRTNTTSAQQAPNRIEADSLWYVRLGYGGVLGPTFASGPAFGFGYRYELDNLGIDFSFLNFTVGNNNSNSGGSAGVSGSWIKLMGLYFLNPTANRSSYLGAGLGWGVTAVARNSNTATTTDFTTYSGTGLQGELSVGYEFLRASTIRMFVQGDATLPFYLVRSSDFLSTTNQDTSYAPSFVVSFGIGWGRSITRVHIVN